MILPKNDSVKKQNSRKKIVLPNNSEQKLRALRVLRGEKSKTAKKNHCHSAYK